MAEIIVTGDGNEGQAPVAAVDASVALAAGQATAVSEQAAEDAAEAAEAAELAETIAENASETAWDARFAVDELRAEMAAALDELRAGIASAEIVAEETTDDSVPVPERIGNESPDDADKTDDHHETDSAPARSSYGHPGWFGGK